MAPSFHFKPSRAAKEGAVEPMVIFIRMIKTNKL